MLQEYNYVLFSPAKTIKLLLTLFYELCDYLTLMMHDWVKYKKQYVMHLRDRMSLKCSDKQTSDNSMRTGQIPSADEDFVCSYLSRAASSDYFHY